MQILSWNFKMEFCLNRGNGAFCNTVWQRTPSLMSAGAWNHHWYLCSLLLLTYGSKKSQEKLKNLNKAIEKYLGRDPLLEKIKVLNQALSICRTFMGYIKGTSVTVWKVSKYGVFSGLYFPMFGLNKCGGFGGSAFKKKFAGVGYHKCMSPHRWI